MYLLTKYTFAETDGEKTITKNEAYLVDCVGLSDAETKVTEEAGNLSELLCTAATPVNVWDIVRNDSGETWYKGAVDMFYESEKTGKQMRRSGLVFINANSQLQASTLLEEHMKGGQAPFEIKGVVDAKIIDILD